MAASEWINLTADNVATEHLCCIIRAKNSPPGVEEKRRWLAQRLAEGHVFRKLDENATVFIEYAPLETAWAPILGERYLYIYCLWVDGAHKGRGYGTALMNYCLSDARARGMAGVCMLGAKKQKHWLSDQAFAKRFGFEAVDSTADGYELLALSLDGTKPHFAPQAKRSAIDGKELTIYYDMQCPYVKKSLELVARYCGERDIPVTLICVDSLKKAKALPCVFNNFAVFYGGRFQTVNLLDAAGLKRLLGR